MKCFDIHTHHSSEDSIRSCFLKDMPLADTSGYRSVGLHPWYMENEGMQLQWMENAAREPNVLAIGECGMDKLVHTPLEKQAEVFRKCVEISEKTSLPLIIHAVRCSNEIIRIKKELNPRMPWIIHGFRGKRIIAEDFLKQGFYLSFGEKFQPESLLATPSNRLFIETDESPLPIESIYQKATEIRALPLEELKKQVWNNVQNVFFRR